MFSRFLKTEVLLDQGRNFNAKLKKAGVSTEFMIEPFQPHDYFTMDTQISQARKAYRRIGDWIKKQEGYKI